MNCIKVKDMKIKLLEKIRFMNQATGIWFYCI